MEHATATSLSDRAAGSVAIFTSVVVIAMVAAGWHRILLNTLPQSMSPIAGFLACVFGILTVALARGIAAERLRLADHAAHTASDRVSTLAYLLMLFFVSGIGTLSGLLYYSEGNQLLKENIDAAEGCLNELEAAAPSFLATPSFDAKKERVLRLRSAYEIALADPRNCGVGPTAIEMLQRLRRELPALHPLSERYASCEAVSALIEKNRLMTDDLLEQTEEYRMDRVAEKQAFRKQFDAFLSQSRSDLADIRQGLGISALGIDKVAARIEAVVKDTRSHADRARSLSTQPLVLSCPSKMIDLHRLGSFWQALPLLVSRSNRLTTHIYLVIAIGIDLVLILLFMRSMVSTRRLAAPTVQEHRVSSPKSLWVDP